ncbi:hypothetical protein ACQKIC_16610 [Peribacillus sp. NPDC046944]|uniref:hypothetical protein n=1 Tax=unclassified Peribacillus TaxID=2675266 RepID=UPI003CFDB178
MVVFGYIRCIGKSMSLFLFVSFLVLAVSGCSDSNKSIKEESSEPILNTKINKNATISKDELKQIQIGDSYKKVLGILGEPNEVDTVGFMWNYTGNSSQDSYGIISYDFENKVESIEQFGITSSDTTLLDDSGINNYDNPKKSTGVYKDLEDLDTEEPTNKDYIYDVESAIEDALGETVDWNDKSKEVVKEIEINDNLGKNDGSKLILVHLNAPVKATNNFIKKKVNEQTLEIAKSIKDDSSIDFTVDSITYFWYLPLTDSNGKTKSSKAYKISLEKDTLENINYEDLDSVDLPAIADQYNVLFKE